MAKVKNKYMNNQYQGLAWTQSNGSDIAGGGDAVEYHHFERSLTVSHEVMHTPICVPEPSKRMENICPCKYLYVNSYSIFIHKHQKL